MYQSCIGTPQKPTDTSDTSSGKKRELPSPFSPEDKLVKKNKASMSATNTDSLDNSMEAAAETEILTQTHMLTLPDTELHKITEIIIPTIQGDILSAIRNDLTTLIKVAVSEVIDDNLSKLQGENECLHCENEELKCRIIKLEQSMDDIEQYSQRNCLSLSSVPETASENTDEIVLKAAEIVGANISPRVIDRSHSIGKTGAKIHRDIIVKFVSYRARECLFANRAKLKDSEMDGVYVNEDLSRVSSKLLYEARRLVKAKKPRLLGACSSDGRS